MLFALSILLLVSSCLPSIRGYDVTDRNTDLTNAHLAPAANRPLPQRNQTKTTRNDQLLSLLAARRREIIQNRFKNHIKSIVDISSGNETSLSKTITEFPNISNTLNVHLNLSELLLRNSLANNSDEHTNLSNPSTESNVVNVSSPRVAYKSARKNGDAPQIPEIKNPGKQNNMPIIRNILYRRKMSFLNRKLPLDLEQITLDSLGLTEVSKNPEDLILDNEDSLQVEESSHDKLIYYDVKNNASKKSGNNFEDASDEMKSLSNNNKTVHNNKKNFNINNEFNSTVIIHVDTKNESVLNSSEFMKNETTDINISQNRTNIKHINKNNTRLMSPSLYNYFRPLNVPEEEMQPFLHFGDKLPNIKTNLSQNQSIKPVGTEKVKITVDENSATAKNEEEIDENMDVSVVKPMIYENKIAKINLPNPKVSVARDYFKNRMQLKNFPKNATEHLSSPKTDKKNYIYNPQYHRNMTRNRGFRNTTIFVQNKHGIRHTINLRGNSSLANLKPTVTTEKITSTTTNTPTTNISQLETKSEKDDDIIKLQNKQLNADANANKTDKQTIKILGNQTETLITVIPESSTQTAKLISVSTQKPISTTEKVNSTRISEPPRTTIKPHSTTVTIPTTRILSTAVVTSVSIESSKSKALNKTNSEVPIKTSQNKDEATTDINDLDATVVATLSNYTSQGFQNKSKTHGTSTRNTSSIYPNINLDINSTNISNPLLSHRVHKFTLRPTTTNPPQVSSELNTSTDFIIHVLDIETYSTDLLPDVTSIKTDTTLSKFPDVDITTESLTPTSVKINSRINNEQAEKKVITALPLSTTVQNEFNSTVTELNTAKTEIQTELPTRMFNTTVLTKTDPELPLATLFSVTDFKKPAMSQNTTKMFKVPGTETVISRKSDNDVSIENIHAAYILAALGFLPMMVIVIYVLRSVMRKKHKHIEDFEAELHDSEKKGIIHTVTRLPTLVLDPPNKWEFPRSKLRLQTLLGQGNFGQVWKAEADDLKGHIGLTRLVAVKTIKDGAGTKERDDLLKELAIMQKMGSHPNVVTLLGCCTDKEPYLLIMEYVMYGKLLTFLRDHRTRRDYYNFSDDAATLTARDLTVFAYCVARGMEYLSSKGIIHRDLAARNILVDHNKLCKIADFGMSREAGPGGEVTEPRQPHNALPVRWMAIESLLYNRFTHKSDVWAFGVLLWEIVTLGSSPYANMSGREVMRLVGAGYRLERPSHCHPELYHVMARAWLADPTQRPDFSELRADLAALLEAPPPDGSYVDLESFRADSTVYEIDNCTPRGNYFTVKSRFSEFECDI